MIIQVRKRIAMTQRSVKLWDKSQQLMVNAERNYLSVQKQLVNIHKGSLVYLIHLPKDNKTYHIKDLSLSQTYQNLCNGIYLSKSLKWICRFNFLFLYWAHPRIKGSNSYYVLFNPISVKKKREGNLVSVSKNSSANFLSEEHLYIYKRIA